MTALLLIGLAIWIVSVEFRLDAIGAWQEVVNAIFRRGKEIAEHEARQAQKGEMK